MSKYFSSPPEVERQKHQLRPATQTCADRRNLLPMKEVSRWVNFSCQHIYRLMAIGKFPRPLKLGARRVCFLESEIENWIAERAAERDGASV
jgi:prophage regulatory protein